MSKCSMPFLRVNYTGGYGQRSVHKQYNAHFYRTVNQNSNQRESVTFTCYHYCFGLSCGLGNEVYFVISCLGTVRYVLGPTSLFEISRGL